jgi:hypothetical protein
MKFSRQVVASVFGLVFLTLSAKADMVGTTATVNYNFPTVGSVLYPGGSQTVTAGGTTFDPGDGWNVVVTGTTITFTFPVGWSFAIVPKTFDGFVISDPSVNFSGALLNSTNIGGFDTSDVTFDANDVYINFPFPPFTGLDAGATGTIDVSFATPSAVPEPSSIVLLGSGVLGLVGAARRRFVRG